jgi:hypothetical protein
VTLTVLDLQVLNVQVPFYFKNIVDSMNIDFVAAGGTAMTVAGAAIFACTSTTNHGKHGTVLMYF